MQNYKLLTLAGRKASYHGLYGKIPIKWTTCGEYLDFWMSVNCCLHLVINKNVMKTAKNVDEYITMFPPDVQLILEEVRNAIKSAAPDAEEKISYGMPVYRMKRVLVYFGAHTKHIGFYPTRSGIEVFKDELTEYDISKGTIRFPFDKPIPYDLIRKIVEFRLTENLA